MKSKILSSGGKRWLTDWIPMGLAAVLIISVGISNKQTLLKMLPTLVTLVVQILMARANRFGFLVGGCNAALYGVGFLTEGLYFSAASSILFSFPMQIWSFFHWKKNTEDKVVTFRRLRWWQWGLTVLATVVGWVVCMVFFRPLFADAVYPGLDAFLFLLGIIITVMFSVPYVESQYLNLICGLGNLVLWTILSIKNPADLTYLCISVYNLYRTLQALIIWTVQYRKQCDENAVT